MKVNHFFNLMLISVMVFVISCNSGKKEKADEKNNADTTITQKEEKLHSEKNVPPQKSDLEVFWTDFKSKIMNDDKQGLMNLCNESTKSFLESNYEVHVTQAMKEEVSKAEVSDIENIGNGEMLFSYTTGGTDEETGEYHGSSFGFIFSKVNGKWMIIGPYMAG